MAEKQRFVFVGGLHKSGTSLLARCLGEHPAISAFEATGVPEDEGQHLQSVFPPALAHGGPGKFGFDPDAHLTESSSLVSEENRARLWSEWSRHWDTTKEVLLEKSPPNLIRTRFLQALFPDSHFVIITRNPVAVAYATRKWSHTSIASLIDHWLVCHETFELDRRYLQHLHVLKYEDFVDRPRLALDGLYDFLGLPPAASTIEVSAELNTRYEQLWSKDREGVSSGVQFTPEALRDRDERVAAFGYHLR